MLHSSIFCGTIQWLPFVAYHMTSSDWIQPLSETGATVVHMANSLRVSMATSLAAEVGAGDWRRAKRTATEPVELETQPGVSRESR